MLFLAFSESNKISALCVTVMVNVGNDMKTFLSPWPVQPSRFHRSSTTDFTLSGNRHPIPRKERLLHILKSKLLLCPSKKKTEFSEFSEFPPDPPSTP